MKGNGTLRKLAAVLLVALIVLLAVGSAPAAQAGVGGGVREAGTPVPPTERYEGKTYADWSNMWWEWAFSMPMSDNPLFDETGTKCGLGQHGNVWFLAGIFNESGSAYRTQCVIPKNKALFFPILNFEESNVEAIQDGVGTSEAEIAAFVKMIEDGVILNSLQTEIDGVSIQNLSDYRISDHTALQGFNFRLPEDNFVQPRYPAAVPGKCFYPEPNGPCVKYMAVNDGFYLMIPPLPAGTHTLHFHGSMLYPDGSSFTLDVTYDPLTIR